MAKVAVVAGYGAGISSAFAHRFGKEGIKLALLARTKSRLDDAVADLGRLGVTATAYPTDLSNPEAVKSTISTISTELGPIGILFWNPVSVPGSLLTAPPQQFTNAYDVTVTGLVAAVQAAHEDLKKQQGCILVTGGGLALERDDMAAGAATWGMATLAVAKAAQRKLVHVMHKQLASDGIYVAEVTVCGSVKGPNTPEGSITPEAVADEFWDIYGRRDPAVWFTTKV